MRVLLLFSVVGLVRCDLAPRPVLTYYDGYIHVAAPGLPGAVSVSVTISGAEHSGEENGHAVVMAERSEGSTWRGRVPAVKAKNGEVHYVMTYHLPHTHYTFRGTQQVSREDAVNTAATSLSSQRYLRRRASTVFFDDFSSGHIDPSKWTHTVNAGWFDSHQVQMYTPENVNTYIKNGILYIRPTLTSDTFGEAYLSNGHLNVKEHWGSCDSGPCEAQGWNSVHPIMSGMLRSTAHIRYGKVEIVAKLATGDWFWNALWMMPISNFYGTWPASGEIDIIENAGNRHLTNRNGESAGVDNMISSIHYGVDRQNHVHQSNTYRLPHSTFGDAFHKFWVDWTENHIIIGVDDHPVFTKNTPQQGFYQESHQKGHNVWASGEKNTPFDKPFNLIMNVHVGGNPFDNPNWHNHPYERPWDPKADNQMMQFWKARHLWEPSWQGESAAMQIKSVKMQQY